MNDLISPPLVLFPTGIHQLSHADFHPQEVGSGSPKGAEEGGFSLTLKPYGWFTGLLVVERPFVEAVVTARAFGAKTLRGRSWN